MPYQNCCPKRKCRAWHHLLMIASMLRNLCFHAQIVNIFRPIADAGHKQTIGCWIVAQSFQIWPWQGFFPLWFDQQNGRFEWNPDSPESPPPLNFIRADHELRLGRIAPRHTDRHFLYVRFLNKRRLRAARSFHCDHDCDCPAQGNSISLHTVWTILRGA